MANPPSTFFSCAFRTEVVAKIADAERKLRRALSICSVVKMCIRDRLYIGTNGMGVFIYNPQDKTFEHYFSDNSALVSNRIFTILPEVDGRNDEYRERNNLFSY